MGMAFKKVLAFSNYSGLHHSNAVQLALHKNDF